MSSPPRDPDERRYRTAADYVYARLRESIVCGELVSGERIDQSAAAERFEVSRMPVREALRRLAAEDLIEITPHRGALVRSLSTDDLIDLYDLRCALEGLATRLGVSALSGDDLNRMRDLFPVMEDIVERQLSDDWFQVDWQFHSVLYHAAGRPRLLRYIRMLWDEGTRYRRLRLSMPNELRTSLEGHYAILAACERRDEMEAERLITSTLIISRDKLLAVTGVADTD